MRRCLTLGLLLLFVGATIALADESCQTSQTKNNIVLPATGVKQTVKARHMDEVIYFEDWENGLNGWVSTDMTALPGTWHIDDWFAFGGEGMSWLMGQNPMYCDTAGYDNDWYMTSDSPPIDLPASGSTLTFYSRIGCEIPGGEPAGYNGWDGCNIRISTDGGTTWTVIADQYLTPSYDQSSLYSFGFQHGEGTGIPGWVGQHFDWFLQTADLSNWDGQQVMLRWAFASDPAWCTCDGAGNRWAFGWQVDNIRVFAGSDTVFSNDGDDDTNWHSGTNRPIGGDFWRVADETNPPPSPPSGTHYLACNDSITLSYANDMNNEFVSPYIDLTELDFGTLTADFMVTGELLSPSDPFPDCDYWHWEVGDSALNEWCFASDPCCQDLPSYVHPDAPGDWYLYSQAYTSGFDMTCYIGKVVQFKVVMESNSDNLNGIGPCFDDLTLTFASGFPNDISCTTLQMRFPTSEGYPAYGTAYFENVGSVAQSGVPASWKEIGGSVHRLMPNLALAPGETAIRDFVWTPAITGETALLAYSWLNVDEDLGNDTSYAQNIEVRGAAEDLELGYDNRSNQYRFNYATGNGVLVRFTPEADSVELPFNLNAIRMLFDMGQPGTQEIGLRIFEDDGDAPGEGIFWGDIQVTPSEVNPNWKEVIVDGASGVHGMSGDFWVWLEVLSTEADQRYPQILGDDAVLWENHDHFYTYELGASPQAESYFYMVRAMVTPGTDDADVHELAPVTYNLSQNYPNPFNPTTEISYSIARTEQVSLRVFNLLGQEVAVLADGVKSAGIHKVSFDGTDLSSGVYIYRLETSNFTASHKMVLMK